MLKTWHDCQIAKAKEIQKALEAECKFPEAAAIYYLIRTVERLMERPLPVTEKPPEPQG